MTQEQSPPHNSSRSHAITFNNNNLNSIMLLWISLCTLLIGQAWSFVPLSQQPSITYFGGRVYPTITTTTTTTGVVKKRDPPLIVLKDEDQTDQELTLNTNNENNNNNNNNNNDSSSNMTTTTSASGRSIGSLIMQMKRQEEEFQSSTNQLRRGGGGKEIQAITLDAGKLDGSRSSSSSSKHVQRNEKKNKNNNKKVESSAPTTSTTRIIDDQDSLTNDIMDTATARELDDSVTWMVSGSPTARKELLDSVNVVPLPSVYNTNSTTITSPQQQQQQQQQQQPLRIPADEKYRPIDRDMRHLAVSIASSIEDVDQWRTFCQEGNGGLMPLLECIREGAKCIHLQQQKQKKGSTTTSTLLSTDSSSSSSSSLEQHEEESFLAACSACRALRDLCAVSPELSAVITDGILRANAAWSIKTTSTSHRSEIFQQDYSEGEGEEEEEQIHRRQQHQFGNNLFADFMTMLKYANEYSAEQQPTTNKRNNKPSNNPFRRSRNRRDARLRCKLYVSQLLLAMTVSSDDAVEAIRDTEGLPETILECSSYSRGEQTRRWLRYPKEIVKFLWRSKKKNTNNNKKATTSGDEVDASTATQEGQKKKVVRPFMRAAAIQNNLDGHVRRTANQILAAIGYNRWVPKIPGQKGLRILVMDGGGSRGMVAVSLVKGLVEAMDGVEVSDSFDIIAGTSTGGIISFLVGLRREPSNLAVKRYNQLIKQIFVKSALSTPMMLFTTATYDESSFMDILSDILQDDIMLDSRADPAVPYVFCVASKMSSTPTHVALFRNYNYAGGEIADPFTIDPDQARLDLDLPLELEHELIRNSSYERQKQVRPNSGYKIEGSRHPGSFRVLQRYALRASTAAPTVFKPVMMGGEMYCDGGIVASNPAAVAVHEARALFPDIPIEMVVSVGTGGFVEQKSSPRIGWDGIIGQIVNSATDAEQIHHVLEDILGEGGESPIRRGSHVSQTRYYRLNPTLGEPDEYPIDVTEQAKLERLQQIAAEYLAEPAQQRKLAEIGDILQGRRGWRKWFP